MYHVVKLRDNKDSYESLHNQSLNLYHPNRNVRNIFFQKLKMQSQLREFLKIICAEITNH